MSPAVDVVSVLTILAVVSYGTEGRRNGVNEVPVSKQEFEHIIFRGSDVEDLSVISPPPPSDLPDDPAIVSVSTPLTVFPCISLGFIRDELTFGCK